MFVTLAMEEMFWILYVRNLSDGENIGRLIHHYQCVTRGRGKVRGVTYLSQPEIFSPKFAIIKILVRSTLDV